MLLTEKQLRKYIRNMLLTEGMRFNEDLALIKVEGGYSVSRYATTWLLIKDNRQGPFDYTWTDDNVIAMAVTNDFLVNKCHNAVEVKRMAALDGYGPTMYDLLMEVLDRPIVNDRSSVSPEAYAVMVRYMGRSDVKKMLMDNVFDEVTYPRTETEEDDCEPGSRRKYTRGVLVRDASPPLEDPGDLYRLEWDDDPLSYAYTKDITPRGKEIEQNGKDWLRETGVRLTLIDRWAHQFFSERFE